ncbi:MAG: hypothetical protein ATN35_04280 [Epulopiscium sp. Nele67-Bin004]|nr:MAG: hypothetical protein ATN35_04280 [Epulopiscium sp. Nele67-Bin004]
MKITGIIVEYNPFHNGHLYQIETIKSELNSDYIIVIMSGNFSQRGTPCIVDKFIRTKMALSLGVDMVLELPTIYATASSEFFAQGAVCSFIKSNIVDSICFGSEQAEISILDKISTVLNDEPSEYKLNLKQNMQQGLSFAQARSNALVKYLTEYSSDYVVNFLKQPNNILSIEYFKALKKYNSTIKPMPIERKISNYHDTEVYSHFASATAIRQALLDDDIVSLELGMPKISLDYLRSVDAYPNIEELFPLLSYKLISNPKEHLYNIFDINSKLINSIYNALPNAKSYNEFIEMLTSKTFSRATIYRSLLRILFDTYTLTEINYIRVLGVNKQSTKLLSLLNENSSVPIICNVNKDIKKLDTLSKKMFETDIFATNLYHLTRKQPNLYNQDFTTPFIVL